MNNRQLNRLSNLYFWTILMIGVAYLVTVVWLFLKSFPGAVMLLVYYLDSRKFGIGLESYGPVSQLWVSLGLWVLSVVLIWRTMFSCLKTVRMVGTTRSVISSLKVVSRVGNKVVFDSNLGEIFTAGFLDPKIYIANGLSKWHSSKEVEAMIAHEVNHAKSKDPLRTTLAMTIEGSLPVFPGKGRFIKYFYTLVEVCADKRAEEKLKNRTPLVAALYKRLEMGERSVSAGVSLFNSQSERINLLIGKKELNKNMVLGAICSTIVGVVIFSILATKYNFYNCPHLSLCLSAITSVLELH